jgi:mannose/fructose/N-acetylgalactosamine-specific phosphotransferase system component IIB
MAVVLYRIDDRLIHGQVVIGWGRPLGVTRIVLVDDQVAASPWEQDLYRMAVPPEIEVTFATAADAAAHLPGWTADGGRVAVLTGDISTMAALHAARSDLVQHVNLGGIHHRPGRIERLRYLYLTEEELEELRRLAAAGADVTAQDLPTAPPVRLEALG